MRAIQIGFPDCGTPALARMFRACGLRVLHGNGAEWRDKGHPALARRSAQLLIHANLRAGRAAFHGLEDFQAFVGLEYAEAGWHIENFRHFARMAEDDPEARFVLNTCDADDWLRARLARDNGGFLERAMQQTGMSRRGVLNLWADDFHRHHDMVRTHFRDRPDRLLEFDMQHTAVRDLLRFVRPGAPIWPMLWRHRLTEAA